MNWGYRLMIAFIAFGGLMATLVYKSVNTKFELVSNTYYEDELKYQSIIDGKVNAREMEQPVTIEAIPAGVIISIPAEQLKEFHQGELWFYCETDAKKDYKSEFHPDEEGKFIVPKTVLGAEKYIVKLQWKSGDKNFYTEKIINF